MSKKFNVCGLGNAVVDIFLELDEQAFGQLGFERGTMRLVELDEQESLLEKFHDGEHDLKLVSGGSVANSIIATTQLGGTGAFIGCVGDDRYGLHYAEEFEQLNIDIGNPVLVGERTGTCLAIVTPDAERTMRTCLAVSSKLAARHVDAQRIIDSEWLFIEGYVFANPETGQGAIREAIKIAKQNDTKVALTASDGFIPEVFGDAFRDALQESDLVFCNAPESVAITRAENTEEASKRLADMVPNSVVTDGENGAFVRYAGDAFHVPAVQSQPKDLTGAGDMFAGAFLFGVTNGFTAEQAARGANFLCHKVISQVGARLSSGATDYWKEVV
ncbi:MAG TPA: adenosine kinase [Planctomycetaceae bacterium]|nr:adenosine kinase [Planctomycetaceae bacterium]